MCHGVEGVNGDLHTFKKSSKLSSQSAGQYLHIMNKIQIVQQSKIPNNYDIIEFILNY